MLARSGIDHGTIYTLRHTAITNWLAAGLTVFEVSRYAGTSVPMIDQHYGHLAIGHEDAAPSEAQRSFTRLAGVKSIEDDGNNGAIPLPD